MGGGSLSGDIGGQISANAGLPPPIASVASVSVWGGANGCITMQVAPDVALLSSAVGLKWVRPRAFWACRQKAAGPGPSVMDVEVRDPLRQVSARRLGSA